jgi:hypothetical protein
VSKRQWEPAYRQLRTGLGGLVAAPSGPFEELDERVH